MSRLSKQVTGVFMKPLKPFIEIENYGHITHVKVLGIDFSKGILRADYKGRKALARQNKSRILIEIETSTLLETLATLSDEQICEAWQRLEPYLKLRKRENPATSE